MMKMKKFLMIFSVLVATLALASCSMEQKLTYKGVDDFAFDPWTRFTLYVRVDSDLRKDVEVKSMNGTIYYRGREIGTTELDGKLVLPAKQEKSVAVPLRIKLTNPLVATSIMADAQNAIYDIMFDVEAEVKYRKAERIISRENVALYQFLPNFAY